MIWLVIGVLLAAVAVFWWRGQAKPTPPDPEQLARDEARLQVVLADKARMAQPTLLLRPTTDGSGFRGSAARPTCRRRRIGRARATARWVS